MNHTNSRSEAPSAPDARNRHSRLSEADVTPAADDVIQGGDESSGKPKLTCAKVWRDPQYFRWITTFVWALGGAFTFGIIGDFSMFYIYLEKDMEASVMELNWIGSLAWILLSACQPVANLLARKLGFRVTLTGSCAFAALGLCLSTFPQQVWPLYITYSLIFGGGCVIFYCAGCVYITGFFDEKTCNGPVSSLGFAFELGILVFSPVIQVTADAWGWRWSMRLLCAFTIAVTVLVFFCIRPPPLDLTRRVVQKRTANEYQRVSTESPPRFTDDDEKEPNFVEDNALEVAGQDVTKPLQRYIQLFSMPSLWLMVIAIIISMTALSFNHINLGSYLTSVGLSTELTAILHSFLAGGAVFGRFFVLILIHKLPISIASIYPVISLLSCLLSVLILLVTDHWMLYIYATVTGCLRGLYLSLSTGLAIEMFGITYAAESYAGVFLGWGVGSILAAVIPGITHAQTGSYTASVITCAGFWGASTFLFVILFFLHRRNRPRRRSVHVEDSDKKISPKKVKARAELTEMDVNENDTRKTEALLVAEIMTTV